MPDARRPERLRRAGPVTPPGGRRGAASAQALPAVAGDAIPTQRAPRPGRAAPAWRQESRKPEARSRARRALAAALFAAAGAGPALGADHFYWQADFNRPPEWNRAGNWLDENGTPYAFPSQPTHIAAFLQDYSILRDVDQNTGRVLNLAGLVFQASTGAGSAFRLSGSGLSLGAAGISSNWGQKPPVLDLPVRLAAEQTWSVSSLKPMRMLQPVTLAGHDLRLQGWVGFEGGLDAGTATLIGGIVSVAAADDLANVRLRGSLVRPENFADFSIGQLDAGQLAPLAGGQIVRIGGLGLDGSVGGVSGTGSLVKRGGGVFELRELQTLQGNGYYADDGLLRLNGSASGTRFVVRSQGRLELAAGSRVDDSELHIGAGRVVEMRGATLRGGSLNGAGVLVAGGDSSTINTIEALRTRSGNRVEFPGGRGNFRELTHGGELRVGAQASVNIDQVVVAGGGRIELEGVAHTRHFESLGQLQLRGGALLNNVAGDLVLGPGSRSSLDADGARIDLNGRALVLTGGLLGNDGRIDDGAVRVNFGGQVRGSGRYASLFIGDGGRLVAGSGLGSATAGELEWGAGGSFLAVMADATGEAGVGWGLMRVDGLLRLSADSTATGRFTVVVQSLDGSGSSGLARHFDADQAGRWSLVQAAGIEGFAPDRLTLDMSGFANPYSGRFSLAADADSLDLVYQPVPEPERAALLALGLVAVYLRRRRRPA